MVALARAVEQDVGQDFCPMRYQHRLIARQSSSEAMNASLPEQTADQIKLNSIDDGSIFQTTREKNRQASQISPSS